MSRRKQSKSDLDDLDDVLGDLLGDDDPPKKTPAKGRGAAGGGKKGPSVFDDAFYANMAAEVNTDSDVSDANPDEIAKSLAGLDDMESALFGGGASSGRRASTPKTPENKTKTGGAEATTVKSAPAKKPIKPSDIDFDDDDPLAGLLSDEEDTKPKVKSRPARSSAQKEEPKTEETKPVTPSTAPEKDDDSSSQNSRRLEIDRPPTRSGNQDRKGKKGRQDDIMFDDDDDDVLGGMGLESPGRQRPAAAAEKQNEDDSSSFLASLGIGRASSAEKPGSGSRRPETFFDRMEKKATTGKPVAKETKEEEIAFGSYMPSAASGGGTGGSRPSSHRSVRFEDDDERPSSRHSTPGGRRRGGSYLDDILNKDDTNWLDMAAGSSAKSTRPSSEGSARKESSEPVDWLGLSRLGSPDTKPTESKVSEESGVDGPLKSALKTPPEERPSRSQPAKNDTQANDWLGLGDSAGSDKDDDWLTPKKKPTTRETPSGRTTTARETPSGRTAATRETPSVKPAATVPEPAGQDPKASSLSRQDNRSDDWLSLGSDKEDESKNDSMFGDDNLLDVSIPRAGRRVGRSQPATSEKSNPPSQPAKDDLDDLSATLQALKTERASKTSAEVIQPPKAPPAVNVPLPISALPQPQVPQTNILQQQQTLFAQQQQMQQTQMQQQIESQMARMRQQQEEQMQMLQAQQGQMMQQMNNPMMDFQSKLLQQQQQMMQQQMMKMPMTSSGMGFSLPGMDDLESKVKRLEFEKQHMDLMSANVKKQHEQEVKLIETSYQRQIQLLEETFQKRETRLREENEQLNQQLIRKQDEWDKTKQEEIKQLKDLHREEINALRTEREEGLSRLRKAKDLEIEAISTSQSHAKSLQLVMEQISANARDLSDLHKAVDGHNESSLQERETSVKTRDQQLKTLQERLERQHHENEIERSRLQGLITKLEHQLTEQTRVNEEERWSLVQEKNRLNSLQTSLERERVSLQEQLQRERMELQKARESLLEEQRSILGQLHDERRILAEERAQFHINQKLKQDKEQRDSLHHVKNGADLESGIKLLGEEKQRTAILTAELQQQRDQIQTDRSKLEQEKRKVELEWEKLQQANMQVNQRSKDIEDWVNEACKARDEGNAALAKAQQLEAEQMQRLQAIQAQLQALRDKERTIAQERLSLAREKKNLEQSWSTVLCVSCRTPIKDTGPGEPAKNNTSSTFANSNGLPMSQAATNLYNALDPDLRSKVNTLSDVAKSIEADRSVRQWRIASSKDKEFLKEESMFLEALRHTPYH